MEKPKNKSLVDSLTPILKWEAVNHAVKYQIQFARDDFFDSDVIDIESPFPRSICSKNHWRIIKPIIGEFVRWMGTAISVYGHYQGIFERKWNLPGWYLLPTTKMFKQPDQHSPGYLLRGQRVIPSTSAWTILLLKSTRNFTTSRTQLHSKRGFGPGLHNILAGGG